MDTMSGKYDTMTNNTRMCLRKCDGKPRLCYYQFNLVPYRTLSPACGNCPQVKSDCYLPQCVTADGVARGITTINRMLPGPAIQVCEGDTVVVDLINSLPSGSTTIHWHGIRQMGSQYYDGVPYVTQCPILPDTTFRYQFKADTSGSFFYHSHLGFQKLDGASGPLIVRENPNVKRNYQYDEDLPSHILYIQDWMHILAEDKFPYTREPNSYLVNGRGIYVVSSHINFNLHFDDILINSVF
ncbi:hypothetical protein O3M35_000670 [Rhynocoris fuscipes]|uniref:Plastocyanin-like domain-containing protein n=1 Tax=Rhynocoris fuscipes TaxID=488301 RepID=A0AAW1DR08_9HEMI